MSKLLFFSAALMVLGSGVVACGGSGARTGSGRQSSSDAAVTDSAEQLLKGDGDYDYPGDYDNDSSGHDEDSDTDDYSSYKNNDDGYYDNDDYDIRTFGRAASAEDSRAVAALVVRYYQAAAAGNSVMTCSLLYKPLAESVVEDYGQAAGPVYLRSGKTCHAVMSLLFKHFQNQLIAPVKVTGVRVNGRIARVLFGSNAMPASVITVEWVGGAWKLGGLLGSPLP